MSKVDFSNEYYLIDEEFRLVYFNEAVKERFPNIKVGDLCYEATMNRTSPCMHCAIAGNADNDCPIYFDPFYNDWAEAIFSKAENGIYSVICRPTQAIGISFFDDKSGVLHPEDFSGKAVNAEVSDQFDRMVRIISGFNSVFFFTGLIDLEKMTFTAINSPNNNIKAALGKEGPVKERFERMVRDFVLPESQKDARDFLDYDTIAKRIGSSGIISLDYQGATAGWSKASMIPTRRNARGEATEVLLTLRSINVIKENEHKQKSVLDEQMTIITGLSSEYFSVMIVDYVADVVKVFRRISEASEKIGELFSLYDTWTDCLKAYTEKYVAEIDAERVYHELSIENITRSDGDFTGEYIQIVDDHAAHISYKVAYGTHNGSQFAVIGLRNVDREHRNQEKLRDAKQTIARSYSLIEGLSREYHTVWYVTAADRKMSLFRTTKNATIPAAVQLALEDDDYTSFINNYIDNFVEKSAQEAMRNETRFENLVAKLAERPVYTINFLRVEPNGAQKYHQMVVSRALEENDVANLVVAFRDVDSNVRDEQEKKRMLQEALFAAEQANRAKTAFLNNMSHDIRTPMNAIVGFTTVAEHHTDDPEQVKGCLEKIHTSSQHLLSLINDVLDMSRIESGKMKLEEHETHLPEIFRKLRTMAQNSFSERELSFEMQAENVINEDVICDELRLNQILMNILSNAAKYTKPGGSVILRLIQLPCEHEGYAKYEFRVKDTGIGMPKEFMGRIFEPFERMSNSTVSRIQGTGLGMSIAKNIADMMGGDITVESELGAGSEFTVHLELKICEASAAEDKMLPLLRDKRVLVIDRDFFHCVDTCNILQRLGMQPDYTCDIDEVAELVKKSLGMNAREYTAFVVGELPENISAAEYIGNITALYKKNKPSVTLIGKEWADVDSELKAAGVTGAAALPLFMSELKSALASPYIAERELPQYSVDFTGRKILLVEDNELNQELAVEILSEVGFILDVASDGDIAVAKMAKAKPGDYDLILMDIQMPVMNGYEATRQIRLLNTPLAREITIIAMTANAFEEDKELAFSAGMNGYLSKPIETKKLMETLAELFRNKPKTDD